LRISRSSWTSVSRLLITLPSDSMISIMSPFSHLESFGKRNKNITVKYPSLNC
jgi:hypothetical protein